MNYKNLNAILRRLRFSREFEADDGIISPLQLATDAEYAGIYDPETDWIVSLGVRGETRIYSPDENDGNAYKTWNEFPESLKELVLADNRSEVERLASLEQSFEVFVVNDKQDVVASFVVDDDILTESDEELCKFFAVNLELSYEDEGLVLPFDA